MTRSYASEKDKKSDSTKLNIQEKADLYIKSFPKYCPLQVFNDRFYGLWMMGNYYGHSSSYYGEFPNSLKQRILSLFPDCNNILHLFSGQILDQNVLTFDVNPDLKPTICDDVRNIEKYAGTIGKIDLVIADPPYDKPDFQKYGVKPFNKSWVIRVLGHIMKSGSFLVWLDTRVPMYSKKDLAVAGICWYYSIYKSQDQMLIILSKTIKMCVRLPGFSYNV